MTLNMLYLPVSQRLLLANAREHGLARADDAVETGYLMHALFVRLFGELTPVPFAVQEADWHEPAQMPVLAYSLNDHQALAARAAPDPLASAIAWQRAGTRALPAFGAGQTLSYRVRVCPAVRVGKHHPVLRPGAEVDPYVVQKLRQEQSDDPTQVPERMDVYRQWLQERFGVAANMATCRIAAMRDARLWRKGVPGAGRAIAGRQGFGGRRMLARRELICEGQLVVNDETAFAALLARGLGRHRAFGFGMLLLKPV